MRKIIFLIALVLPICAYATDMCARDDTMVLVLDSKVGGSGSTLNKDEWSWVALYTYGRIQGESTCVSTQEKQNGDIQPGLSGTDANGNPRGSCFCKMTHPVVSGWVGTQAWGMDGCVLNCVYSCGQAAGTNINFRQLLFDTVGL